MKAKLRRADLDVRHEGKDSKSMSDMRSMRSMRSMREKWITL